MSYVYTTSLFEAVCRQFPKCREIGKSREGLPIFALTIGSGPIHVSLTAGAHSDEPAGPLAALELANEFADNPQIRKRFTFHICPHVNPDGLARNEAWFLDPPEIIPYAQHAFREPPGDDVEFNYPSANPDAPTPRPENIAVAEFLREGAPYHLHLSLHGMGFAEGAWWLIGKGWIDRTAKFRATMVREFESSGVQFHDIDRHGEKGFTRIERGFSTTPTSTAMKAFFDKEGDPSTGRLFLPSSMEFVQSLGGDPLVMVSEIPIFRIHGGGPLNDPPGDDTPFLRFRPNFREARKRLEMGDESPLRELVREYDVRPVPWKTQIDLIKAGVRHAMDLVSG